VLETRRQSMKEGVVVEPSVWQAVRRLSHLDE
jgi:hypothetical protein